MAKLQGNDAAFVAAQLTQAWASVQPAGPSTDTVKERFLEFLIFVANQDLPEPGFEGKYGLNR